MSKYVPVAELPNAEQVLERPTECGPLGWDIALPAHIDTERLEVNMRQLSTLHRVAAFTAGVVTEYYADKSGVDAVAGVNPDGSAIAGKAMQHRGKKSAPNLIYSDIHDPTYREGERYAFGLFKHTGTRDDSWGKPIVNHRLNREEIVDQVIGSNSKKDDHHKWAVALNGALKDSYMQSMRANLTVVPRGHLLFDTIATPNFYALMIDSVLANGHPPTLLHILYAGVRALDFMGGTMNNVYYGAKPLNEFRPSLFATAQFDRYIAARALAGSSTLVRAKS